MQLFYCPGLKDGDTFLDSEESHHCVKVLRKKEGDIIDITDGHGSFYKAQLLNMNPKKCLFNIISCVESEKEDYFIHIAIAPTKNTDRMEWFVEKAVEIGINKISFIQTVNCERRTINLDRIKKKAISAMKQSVRAILPEVMEMEPFLKIINGEKKDQNFIAHLDEIQTPFLERIAKPGVNYLLLIGPEGGFTEEELSLARAQQFQSVKIGNFRLRTETAGIVATTILNQINH